MLDTINLLSSLKSNYPELNYIPGKKFSFRPPKTIHYIQNDPNFNLLILHETAHALLKHKTFKTDVERLKMESDTWAKTEELCSNFGVPFDAAQAESELDSYRDWLHSKSICPKCGLTRFETNDGNYHCPNCEQ